MMQGRRTRMGLARVLTGLTLLLACSGTVRAEDNAFWVHHPAEQARGTAPHTKVAQSLAVKPARHAGARVFAAEAARATPVSARGPAAPARSIAEQLQTGQSSPWAIVTGLTLLSLLPAILLAMTPLVRLLVVFHFLRQALGTQTAPSNQVLMGLGLMMTWFLMQPVFNQVEQQAIAPYRAGQISGEAALSRGAEPVRHFMLQYARDKDLELFASTDGGPRPASRADVPMRVVVPAYMLSELKSGFQIGAVLFLPFLLVDLVVASVTTAVGMVQLPPVVISTPVKILLFVMVDGWHLLASSLLKSFH
ncbi:flagellar type III secretion system pore protein FliP [Terriglobus sp.]|uniref:flagellar type III secretion system pore protein FliP n=1 Tax=Terriglobus sp. TaxID=1889013 RepID=UPI003AFFFA65